MNYKEFRACSPIVWYKRQIAELLCMYISPFFSQWFINRNIRPNSITLIMVILGVIGCILFAFPFTILKIAGACSLWLWYVMDCSDGEVARFTKCFSRYGKEMDQLAHLLCHPLFVLSVYISYEQIGNATFCSSLMILTFLSFEMINRAFVIMDTYLEPSYGELGKISIFRYILMQLFYFPNMVLFFPWIFLLGNIFNMNTLPIFLGWSFVYSLYVCYRYILTLKKFYSL